MSAEQWEILLTCVILTCRHLVCHERDWLAVDRRIGEITAVQQPGSDNIVAALLQDLSDPIVRRAAVERALAAATTLSESELRKFTAEAAFLVDRIRPDQSFAFRAGLTLISLSVTGRA